MTMRSTATLLAITAAVLLAGGCSNTDSVELARVKAEAEAARAQAEAARAEAEAIRAQLNRLKAELVRGDLPKPAPAKAGPGPKPIDQELLDLKGLYDKN